MHRRCLSQRLRRGHGGAPVRQRGGLRAPHERAGEGARSRAHALFQLHGAVRRRRALHLRARCGADVARAAAPREHQGLHHDLDGLHPRRGVRAGQHQQARQPLSRLHRAQDRLHLDGALLSLGLGRAGRRGVHRRGHALRHGGEAQPGRRDPAQLRLRFLPPDPAARGEGAARPAGRPRAAGHGPAPV